MENKPKINAYICPKLHVTITRDCEEGVTPFIILCPKCQGHAKSQMYTVEQNLTPTHEWYKPSTYEGLSDNQITHVKNGGLLLRKIEG